MAESNFVCESTERTFAAIEIPPFSPGPASTISNNPRAHPSLATSNMPTTVSKQLLNGDDKNTAKKTAIAPETVNPKP